MKKRTFFQFGVPPQAISGTPTDKVFLLLFLQKKKIRFASPDVFFAQNASRPPLLSFRIGAKLRALIGPTAKETRACPASPM
ncbi:hypothetical protein HMPREF0731_3206 [Pseudoroseomonas cervicalis ATCC 49957]|uniref:Uncharacterized protein n=1 Tax=Pseudoroseomonas cervicalis ATCC 49957 TaxID=525371 RepID=D5RQ44_9PROT|nr:hypothetical protein HMPREF0731_3206 [Pseudoroseomonas cervicalis ATCC 49957]